MRRKNKFCMKKKVFGKCLLALKNRFAVEKKKQKKMKQIINYMESFLCRHQKNASYTISIYGKCMTRIFFKKRKPLIFVTR